MTTPQSATTTIIHDGAGRPVQEQHPNGMYVSKTYDLGNRVRSIITTKGTLTLSGSSYGYTPAGVRVLKNDLVTGTRSIYEHDASNQVSGESAADLSWYDMMVDDWSSLSVDDWAALPVDSRTAIWSASYDDNGNPLTLTDASGTTTFTYDDANRMQTQHTPSSMTTFSYDSAGNMLARADSVGGIGRGSGGCKVGGGRGGDGGRTRRLNMGGAGGRAGDMVVLMELPSGGWAATLTAVLVHTRTSEIIGVTGHVEII